MEFERSRQAEKRELVAALAARDADLRMLRAQIDPHFLFNSLNSISALTAIDAGRARAMTVQLADFFRLSLRLNARAHVSLRDEADLAMRFLAIEQTRFGARLRVECSVEESAGQCLVPPMLLQPLVENAVKHGIGNISEGGLVSVRAARAGSQLHIVVENTVDSDTPARTGEGLGLANVRQRLTLAYEHHASVHCERQDDHYRVTLTLPAHVEEAVCA
jgi:LytS/YehU family sensor histidine kinase